MEWVEIIEPRSRHPMYANLTTGECLWDPPDGVPVKRTHENQWWELFDQNTSRFYYYNATSQKTVWHKPTHGDIIPLAKLQTLKQNTEADEDDVKSRADRNGRSIALLSAPNRAVSTSQTQTSPTSPARGHRHQRHQLQLQRHRHHHNSVSDDQQTSRQPPMPKDPWVPVSSVPSGCDTTGDRGCRCRVTDCSKTQHQVYARPGDLQFSGGRRSPGATTPSQQRRRGLQQLQGGLHKQRSLEQRGGGLAARDSPLSRSYSFMQQRRAVVAEEDAMHEQYLLPAASPPSQPLISQPQQRRSHSSGVDSLCTPMAHRRGAGRHHRRPYHQLPASSGDSSAASSSGCSGPPSPVTPSQHAVAGQLDSGVQSACTTAGSQRSGTAAPTAEPPAAIGGCTTPQQLPCKPVVVHDTTAAGVGDDELLIDPATQTQLIPLHQYILQQAKLSGYSGGSGGGEDGQHSWRSGDSPLQDDSDEFADDEGVSNADSSGLDDYLEEDDRYQNFILPPHLRQRANRHNESDTVDRLSGRACSPCRSAGGSSTAAAGAVSTLPRSVTSPPSGHQLPYTAVSRHASLSRPSRSVLPAQLPLLRSPSAAAAAHAGCATGGLSRRAQASQSSLTSSAASTLPDRSPLFCPTDADAHMHQYALQHINLHKRGLFRKKNTVRDMLSWSKDGISKPMIATLDKSLKREACETYRLVQIYMGDRKARTGMSLNSVGAQLAAMGWANLPLRDEIYVQVCRQTTENPRRDSLRRGWELLAICLQFFPPSERLRAFLDGYIARHREPEDIHQLQLPSTNSCNKQPNLSSSLIQVQIDHFSRVCSLRLERNTARRCTRKPTEEDVDLARLQIFRASMFGSTLQEVMNLQGEQFPHRRLPWILTTLTDEVLRLQGTQTEGIFRVAADAEEVYQLRLVVDRLQLHVLCSDAHAPASLLKQWLRELWQPLVPDCLYDSCVDSCSQPRQLLELLSCPQLPELNRITLAYLIRFLQMFSRAEVVQHTKMDASNLAMVFAPNVLRCRSSDAQIVLDNARKEMAFMHTLIEHMDTQFMEGIN